MQQYVAMDKKNHYIVYGVIVAVCLWVLYLARAAVTPFVLAAAFAYLLNPFVAFLTHRVRLPRHLSIIVIYLLLISLLTTIVIVVSNNLALESAQFARETRNLMHETNSAIAMLPAWLQPITTDGFESVRSSLLYPQKRVADFLPGAVNRTISVLVFLVASFYFLRDGHKFIAGFFRLFPKKVSQEIETVSLKINSVLGNYLRGQLLLVIIMAGLTYVGLTIIGVRYALILSIFTGFAEIVPYVGPVVAALVAMGVAFGDQMSRFNQLPLIDLVSVGALYFVLRQLEDLFIIPNVLGRLTKLHPLIVMFSVLAGGHLFGLLGYLGAVPVVASLKVVINHIHDLLEKDHEKAL